MFCLYNLQFIVNSCLSLALSQVSVKLVTDNFDNRCVRFDSKSAGIAIVQCRTLYGNAIVSFSFRCNSTFVSLSNIRL